MQKAPKLLEPVTEDEIMAQWKGKDITVSILCATFNHEDFIEDAIHGFLSQKTTFPFEVIIRDDASSDRTAKIIKSFADKYPDIIKPIFETVNQYPHIKAMPILRNRAMGKYLAYCEGDDYWIDPLKLQKQVDYLESHPNVSLLETNSVAIENGYIIDWPGSGGTRTFMHPAKIAIPNNYSQYINFGDTYLRAIMETHGDTAKLDDVTAVWRKHEGGVFGSSTSQQDTMLLNFNRANTNFWISVYQSKHSKNKEAFYTLQATINQLLNDHPITNYKVRLKLASYLILHPIRPILGRLKRKLRSIT